MNGVIIIVSPVTTLYCYINLVCVYFAQPEGNNQVLISGYVWIVQLTIKLKGFHR